VKDANRNQLWARAVAEELARAAVKSVCLAPGSRSTPLVLACADQEELRLVPHLDERSAGFFALGLGRATRRPTAVITTSGTATANLLPPVVEASRGEVPLLLLTADRPHHLRDSDANQAIDQLRLYGEFVREFFEVAPPRVDDRSLRHLRTQVVRAVASTLGPAPGPVHMNFPFEKPLEPTIVLDDVDPDFSERHPLAAGGRAEGRPFTRVGPRRTRVEAAEVEAVAVLLEGTGRGLVVAGPTTEPERTGPAAVKVAAATGFPLVADPLSGARYGPAHGAVVAGRYDLFLGHGEVVEALRPEVVLRIGASPTSAALCRALEAWGDARQIVVDAGHRWKDHLATAADYLQAEPVEVLDILAAAVPQVGDPAWRTLWRRAEGAAEGVLEQRLRGPFFEGSLLREAADGLLDGETIFVSNSMPIRDLDAYAPPRDARLRVFANRGASGIDGIVSTALGVSAGLGERVVAVLGDLAFYHDMNGLLAARERGAEVVFVVIHNDGGGIFHMLPVREHEPAFTPFFATPHGLDFRHAAQLYGLPYARVEGRKGLRRALRDARKAGGSRIVVVESDREENRRLHEKTEGAVQDAVRRALAQAKREEEGTYE